MGEVRFRVATRADLPAIVALLADDVLGADRERTDVDDAYERAFADIASDARNDVIVADDGGVVVGCLQVTYIPGLGRHGTERALVESVRVRADGRGQRIGQLSSPPPCRLVQLTTATRSAPRRPPLLHRPRVRRLPRGHEAQPRPLSTSDTG